MIATSDIIVKFKGDGLHETEVTYKSLKLQLGSNKGVNLTRILSAEVHSVSDKITVNEILFMDENTGKKYYCKDLPVCVLEGLKVHFKPIALNDESLVDYVDGYSYHKIPNESIISIEYGDRLCANSGGVIGKEWYGENATLENGMVVKKTKSGVIAGFNQPEMGYIKITDVGLPVRGFLDKEVKENDIVFFDKRMWMPFTYKDERYIYVPQWYLLGVINK
jgi:hypothetical protein